MNLFASQKIDIAKFKILHTKKFQLVILFNYMIFFKSRFNINFNFKISFESIELAMRVALCEVSFFI